MSRYSKNKGLTSLRAGVLTSLLAVAASPAVAEEITYKVTYEPLRRKADPHCSNESRS